MSGSGAPGDAGPVLLRAGQVVHGGAQLARHDGQVVFLRGAAPGDLVEAELRPGGKGFLRGRVLRLVERGPARVDAPCPLVERCGGCPVQQVDYAAQLVAKGQLARDALERLGGLAPDSFELLPVVPSPAPLRYRRRARLHRAPGQAFGFSGRDAAEAEEGRPEQQAVVRVDTCLLFEPELQALWTGLQGLLAELGGLPEVLDLGLVTSGKRAAIDLVTAGAPPPRLLKRAEQLLERLPALRGATVGPGALQGNRLLGDPVLADPESRLAEGQRPFRLRVRPDLFAQANRPALPLLQRAALDALGPATQGRVLELFCGAGTLTLPLLAAGAREVIGVESAGPSLQLLRRSAEEAGLAGDRLRLLAGDAARLAGGLQEEAGRLDAVLLDPPRTGAPAAVRAAAALRAPRLVYVSCDAPTLGRDTRLLAEAGYRLLRATPIDLFPQTAHFETVALFQRER